MVLLPKNFSAYVPAFLVFTAVLMNGTSVFGQERRVSSVQIKVVLPAQAVVSINYAVPTGRWSFRNSYARAVGLAERIEDLQATAGNGEPVNVQKLVAGEFQSHPQATNINYRVKLSKPDAVNTPHVSWLTADYGLLMLADLLPQDVVSLAYEKRLAVDFDLPQSWMAHSASSGDGQSFSVEDPDNATFFVGEGIRTISKNVDGMELNMFVSGKWPFVDSKAFDTAARALRNYSSLTRYKLNNKCVVMIAPVAFSSSMTTWRAETRGSSVILAIDPAARFPTWLGQLGVIFTHEVFHLWVPNSLRLRGDYDWFFEGFTLYEALLTAIDLKLIDFHEFLSTLARVYDSYLSYTDGQSLIDAAERRWTSSSSLVYDKGMLVAFVYDLFLRQSSQQRLNLSAIYPRLFAELAGKPVDANKAIMDLLNSTAGTNEFTKTYVESKVPLDLTSVLSGFGFELNSSGAQSRLTIKKDLTAEQRSLLRSIGYKK